MKISPPNPLTTQARRRRDYHQKSSRSENHNPDNAKKSARADGRFGEALALKYLTAKGCAPVAKNFHIRGGEIDLIVKKDGILIFVEVKTRWGKAFGEAEESLTRLKKHKLLQAIFAFLSSLKGPDSGKTFTRWRCDLIAIQFVNAHTAQIKHIIDIFHD